MSLSCSKSLDASPYYQSRIKINSFKWYTRQNLHYLISASLPTSFPTTYPFHLRPRYAHTTCTPTIPYYKWFPERYILFMASFHICCPSAWDIFSRSFPWSKGLYLWFIGIPSAWHILGTKKINAYAFNESNNVVIIWKDFRMCIS